GRHAFRRPEKAAGAGAAIDAGAALHHAGRAVCRREPGAYRRAIRAHHGIESTRDDGADHRTQPGRAGPHRAPHVCHGSRPGHRRRRAARSACAGSRARSLHGRRDMSVPGISHDAGGAALLSLQNVAGGYGDVDIVCGIDMQVAAPEIVTIAGTNGAGKSTLIKAVMGLLPRLSGTLQFNGVDLRSLEVEDRVRVGISYVPQVKNVFGDLTVLENLQVVEYVRQPRARIAE